MTRISTYRMNKILYNKKNLKGFRDPRQNPTAHKNLRPVYGQNTMSTMSTLKQKRWGVMVFCFVQNFFFGQHNIYYFCRAKREIFFQNSTLGYMTKTLNQIIFFFLHQNQNIFFSNIGNQNIFFRKKTYPPLLQVKWSFP